MKAMLGLGATIGMTCGIGAIAASMTHAARPEAPGYFVMGAVCLIAGAMMALPLALPDEPGTLPLPPPSFDAWERREASRLPQPVGPKRDPVPQDQWPEIVGEQEDYYRGVINPPMGSDFYDGHWWGGPL